MYNLWVGEIEKPETKMFCFNTTIQFASGKIQTVKDNVRHYNEDLARKHAIKYNEERGFKVLDIKEVYT